VIRIAQFDREFALTELPERFPLMSVDTKFYTIRL
jgi:hypothetical protein